MEVILGRVFQAMFQMENTDNVKVSWNRGSRQRACHESCIVAECDGRSWKWLVPIIYAKGKIGSQLTFVRGLGGSCIGLFTKLKNLHVQSRLIVWI